MRIERATKLLVDTNVLLEATDTGRHLHDQAMAVFLNSLDAGVDLFICTQSLREYLVVATRPAEHNGLGMSIRAALGNIAQFKQVASIVPESAHASDLFLEWAAKFKSTGKKLHDLQILATAAAGGIHTLLTANVRDFPKVPAMTIAPLAEVVW